MVATIQVWRLVDATQAEFMRLLLGLGHGDGSSDSARIRRAGGSAMDTANVLCKVLLSGETGARTAFAVGVRAVERLLGAAVHLVHFAFVSQQATRVGEALELLTTCVSALVGTIMLVHVFTGKLVGLACPRNDIKRRRKKRDG